MQIIALFFLILSSVAFGFSLAKAVEGRRIREIANKNGEILEEIHVKRDALVAPLETDSDEVKQEKFNRVTEVKEMLDKVSGRVEVLGELLGFDR